MSAPITSGLSISVSITQADLQAIKADGFPVYEPSVTRFHHTTTPYKNIQQPYSAIAAFDTELLTPASMPDWFKEVIAYSSDVVGTYNLLVRESHNSRMFYIEVEVLLA